MAGFSQQLPQFNQGKVTFSAKKNFQNSQPVFKSIDSVLLEQLYELFLFLFMNGLGKHAYFECPGRFHVVHEPLEHVRDWVLAWEGLPLPAAMA